MKLIGERRAIASAVFALYAFFYLVLALLDVQPGFDKAYFAMAAVYGSAFFALVAGYFWARWYAMGVALSGVISGGVALWQLGAEPIVVFIAGTHLAATLMLAGQSMREPFEGQPSWRKRLHMDDNAVVRLGRSVTRASISLPFILLYALAPKPEGADASVALWLAVAASAVGLFGLVRMRTWGLLALLGASGAMAAAAVLSPTVATMGFAAAGTALLASAWLPMAAPIAAMLLGRRDNGATV
ncbi:MAG TPA: hypothetical protein PLF40_24065 [Kofleriaceae bacterium]|jgi:hypothetical protein|nr:hypothetical protein [Kofleriaceae bacterium]